MKEETGELFRVIIVHRCPSIGCNRVLLGYSSPIKKDWQLPLVTRPEGKNYIFFMKVNEKYEDLRQKRVS